MILAVLVALAGAACSGGAGGSTSLMPTGPTGRGVLGGGAQISGSVSGTSIVSGVSPLTGANALTSNTSPINTLTTTSLKVTIAGTDIATSVDGAGKFTLTNVPSGTVVLNFSGPGVSASLSISGVSAGDQIQITVRLDSSNAKVESEERRHKDANDEDDDNDRDDDNDGDDTADNDVFVVHGVVSALSGACPALTFKVGDRTAKTSSSTTFKEMVCSRVQNMLRVEVKGRLGSDGTLAVTSVEIED